MYNNKVRCKQDSFWNHIVKSITVYRLADAIIRKLPYAIKQQNAKVVVITNLLHYFTDDLYLDTNEMKKILKEIIKTINKIQNCLVVVLLGFPTQYDSLFSDYHLELLNLFASCKFISDVKDAILRLNLYKKNTIDSCLS
ncbi:hypothetical protein [Nitrosopumilus sp.]|uniref:hypothetical protein n=1 Tax=Nitrosopumilus sp. TaxID=2024843 RepID=UPI00292CBA76|nr:hypothetical protein [Nitrosopumilus sp.]